MYTEINKETQTNKQLHIHPFFSSNVCIHTRETIGSIYKCDSSINLIEIGIEAVPDPYKAFVNCNSK